MSHVRETKLITVRNVALGSAAKRCGERKEDNYFRYCIMVIVPPRTSCKFWLSIPEGFHAIVTANGQFVGIWDSGFHTAMPYERVSHLVTKQFVVYDSPVKECPTIDNVMVEVDVAVVFSVMEGEENVKKFVYKLGPERLQEMLHAFQEEAVRGMVRQKKYSNIYDLMDTGELPEAKESKGEAVAGELASEEATYEDDDDGGEKKTEGKKPDDDDSGDDSDDDDNVLEQLDNTKKEMNAKLNLYGIEVYSITITNVLLPVSFRTQMEEATTYHSKNIEQESKQDYDLMVIENAEQRNKAIQALDESKEEAVVKKDQKAASEQKTTDSFKAETNSIIAVVNEQTKSNVREIETESLLAVAALTADTGILLATVAAEADSECEKILAEMDGWVCEKKAETKFTVAQLKAQENMLLAQAEFLMTKKMVSKRDFDSKMSNLLVLDRFSKNSDAVMCGTGPSNRDASIATLVGAKNAPFSINLQN